jgi:hypothetical protein
MDGLAAGFLVDGGGLGLGYCLVELGHRQPLGFVYQLRRLDRIG